jgi:hypothetical protein
MATFHATSFSSFEASRKKMMNAREEDPGTTTDNALEARGGTRTRTYSGDRRPATGDFRLAANDEVPAEVLTLTRCSTSMRT